MNLDVRLRDVEDEDLDVFFRNQCDAEANQMVAFTVPDPSDRTAFDAKWNRILADEGIAVQTILAERAGCR